MEGKKTSNFSKFLVFCGIKKKKIESNMEAP
jgi:hypothetical protein